MARKSLRLGSALLTGTLVLAGQACKPAGSGTSKAKAIVGVDALGLRHAFSLMPVKNFIETSLTNVDDTNAGDRYARDLTDTMFFAVIDCVDLPSQTGQTAIKAMEVDAAVGNVYLDKSRRLWRRSATTGNVDERLPCSIYGERIASVYIVGKALDQAYASATPTPESLQLAQGAYLALRGNTNKGVTQVTPTMMAYVTASTTHFGIASMTRTAMAKILTTYDHDLNPCDPTLGKFGKAKFTAYSCVAAEGGNNAYSYQPNAAAGNVTAVRDAIAAGLTKLHNTTYKYNDASSGSQEVMWNALTTMVPWESLTGRSGEVGVFLAGRNGAFDFNQFFVGNTYGVDSAQAAAFGLLDGKSGRGSATRGQKNTSYPANPNRGRTNPASATGGAAGTTGGAGNFNTGTSYTPAQVSSVIGNNITSTTQSQLSAGAPGVGGVQSAATTANYNNEFGNNLGSTIAGSTALQGPAQAVYTTQLANQQAISQGVKSQIDSGAMTADNSGQLQKSGFVGYTNASTGETAFVDPKSGTVQDWKADTSATLAGAPTNTQAGTKGWYDANLGGDPNNNAANNAGLGQTISPSGARSVQVNVAGDGTNPAGSINGVYNFSSSINPATGAQQINCKDPNTAASLKAYSDDYTKTQANLQKTATAEGADPATVQQNLSDIAANKAVYNQVRGMTNCKGLLSSTALALDGETDGGCGDGAASDAPPKDPSTDPAAPAVATDPAVGTNPDGGTTADGGTTNGGTTAGGTTAGGTTAGGTVDGGTVAGGTTAGGTVAGGTVDGGTVAGATTDGGTVAGGTTDGGTTDGGTGAGGTTDSGTTDGG